MDTSLCGLENMENFIIILSLCFLNDSFLNFYNILQYRFWPRLVLYMDYTIVI